LISFNICRREKNPNVSHRAAVRVNGQVVKKKSFILEDKAAGLNQSRLIDRVEKKKKKIK
jgi:hypothetical protein